jgi:asl2061 protein
MINNLIFVVNSFFQIYFWLILLRCLLSFVPSIDWYKQPFEALRDVTDLYLNIFRKIIPPVGGIDFSPIVAVTALQILNYLIIVVLLMFRGMV